jgi:Helix-turn-helix domain
LGELAARLAQLWAGLALPPSAGNGRPGNWEDRLLTLPEVAQTLGVPEDYAYALARQRKIPTVRLPGLDKGKGENRRICEGKYLRVRASSLRALISRFGGQGDRLSTMK